jgi:diguanylate cyclase (GGDEF)-like protein
VWADTSASFVAGADAHEGFAVVMVQDITQRKAAEAALRSQAALNEHQALHDGLTGLANRTLFRTRIEGAVEQRRRQGDGRAAVVVLDLDGFKEINDRRGHAAGDRLLRTASARWLAALRQSDVLGRVGGDEFAVLLEGADRGAAEDIVARLEQALAPTHGASAGLAAWDGEEDASALVSRADTRMYDRKRQRRLALR